MYFALNLSVKQFNFTFRRLEITLVVISLNTNCQCIISQKKNKIYKTILSAVIVHNQPAFFDYLEL